MKLFIVFLLLFFVSCKSTNIAFEFDNNVKSIPTVTISIPSFYDDSYIDMIFGIDTGCQRSCFYDYAAKKLFASEEDFDDFISAACLQKGISKEELLYKELNLELYDVKCGKYTFPKVWFSNTADKANGLEGVLGYEAFKDLGVVLFDFKKNLLTIGKRKIKKNVLPMKEDVFAIEFLEGTSKTVLLSIPIEIEGKTYDSVIDTGFSSDGIPSILVWDFADFPETVTVKIGNIVYEKVEQVKFSDGECANQLLKDNAVFLLKEKLFLGNAFFQNKRIQLDFENMTFAMD